MQIGYKTYKIATTVLSPLITLWLKMRLRKGKESKARFRERFGYSKLPRPKGLLVWLHAASVGETNSVLLLIEQLKANFPDIHILLTTGTVTSAQLIAKRNPKNVIHQFVPVDTDDATNRFLRKWRPDIGFWVESELWPNLVVNAKARGCFMIIINGRMSLNSFNSWQKYAVLMIFKMLSCFDLVFAQSEEDGQRFKSLGARDVRCLGNLKYDAATLTCNEEELFSMHNDIGYRQVWLAASTHEGEEEQVAKAHATLTANNPDLLTIIAPRHPERGRAIAELLSAYGKVALRSRKDKITPETKFYIANTLGEMGLFYRLCEVVFMGGSLVPHGGQNPLEPARLRCCVLSGNNTENFSDIYSEMEKQNIYIKVQNAGELAKEVGMLLASSDKRTRMQMLSKEWLATKGGVINRIINVITPIFGPIAK